MKITQNNKQTEINVEFSANEELFLIERCLKNYCTDLIKKITKGFTKSNKKIDSVSSVLEFGAGVGALAVAYAAQNGIKPDCIEIDPAQAQFIRERGFSCFEKMSHLQKKYDAIYTSNVLEHIKDDTASLMELYDLLKPGGSIAIFVPAFMSLWSQMDELVGHYRRYSKTELCQKVSSAGFNISYCYYADSVGYIAWLYLRLRGYKKGNAISSDNSLIFFDKVLYPISRFFDLLGLRYFFGKSLFLIASKPLNL